MALELLSSIPEDNSSSHYIDKDVVLTFNQRVESSSLVESNFMVWKSNSDFTEYTSQMAIAVDYGGLPEEISVRTLTNFEANSFYMLIAIGGPTGLFAEGSSETMASNLVIKFKTAATEDPGTNNNTEEETEEPDPVSNTLSVDESMYPIELDYSIPENLSVGVSELSSFKLLFDDDLELAPSSDMITFNSSILPIDPDPFADNGIELGEITTDGNILNIDVTNFPADELNTEYVLTIKPRALSGVNREDNELVKIKFLSRLSPLYATPDQIRLRLTGYIDTDIAITDYELYKLILEKSLYLNDVYEIDDVGDNLIRLNRAVICLVLRELFIPGTLVSGSLVKSRELLMTKVEYHKVDIKDVLNELDTCVRENIPENISNSIFGVMTGIKSQTKMHRPTKIYRNAYR